MIRYISVVAAGLVAGSGLLAPSPADAEEKRIIFAGGGGAYQKAVEKHWFGPFTEKTGIEVVYVTTAHTAERRTQVQAMIKTNNMQWDLYQEGELDAEAADHLTRAIDHSAFCKEFDGRPNIPADVCSANGVLFGRGLTLMTYNEKHFPDGGPSTWADFWDVGQFKGVRALPSFSDGWRNLSIALVADGVPFDELYPLDLDRAFAKLDELRDHIGVWWSSGNQTQQGFRDEEFDMALMWMTRTTALKKEGQPIGWSFEGAMVLGDRFAIPQGGPNLEATKELLRFYINNPEVQARVSEALTLVPPTPAALDFVDDETRARMPSAQQMESAMFVPDAKWINENKPMLVERWNAWIQQ